MTTTILNLSDELIVEVVKSLGNDRRTLWALTLTCRRISPIARDALYRDIQLKMPVYQGYTNANHLQSQSPAPPSIFRAKLKLLMRTWNTYPFQLLDTLNSLAINSSLSNSLFLDKFLEMAGHSEGLKSLKMEGCSNRNIRTLTKAFHDLAGARFPKLQNFEIWCSGGSMEMFYAELICSHPSLRKVRIDIPIHPQSRAELPAALSKTSSIRELIISHMHFHSDTLQKILPLTADLEVLEMGIPDNHIIFDQTIQDTPTGIIRPLPPPTAPVLRPQEITRNLVPVRQTLRRLKITSPKALVARYDGSQIDLSTFESLEDLHISSVLLFGSSECMSRVSNNNVTSLLLSSLVKFSICFDTLQGIFYSMKESEYACEKSYWSSHSSWLTLWHQGPGEYSVVANSLGWLQDLPGRCTKLATFDMEETHGIIVMKTQGYRGFARIAEELLSIDVVPYHAGFFANFPFSCQILVYVGRSWWRRSRPQVGSITRAPN